jgi:Carboxypeptidase regulatory-like domain
MRLGDSATCCLFLALALSAQSTPATISGTITDPDGVALPAAKVHAKNSAGKEFEAAASAAGGYSLGGLPAGTYEIEISSPGMKPFQKKEVPIKSGETLRLDARLQDFESLGSLGENREFFSNLLEAHDAPAGPAPRTAEGKPDFSGVWHPLRTVDPGKPDALPWAVALVKERIENNLKDTPSTRCLPAGILDDGTFFAFRVMQNQTILAMLYEEDLPRQIYLDGRKHPEESLSPFIGHSVGRWDGDILVVDTVGFNDKTWLGRAYPHTDKLHVTERYRRKDLGHLEVEITVEDPGTLKQPWVMKRAAELAPADYEVGQYVCTENNRDLNHLVGK